MSQGKEITKVVFRKFKSNGEIIALFPGFAERILCDSYMHVGQHGDADYDYCMKVTVPATPDEYADLQSELQSLGYNLKVYKRRPI